MDPAPPPPDRRWPFRLAAAAWLAVGGAAWYAADGLGLPGQVVLAGLWVAGLALLFRHFVASLFGPVLAYDVLRTGRKKWPVYARVGYAVVLAVIFGFTYASWQSFATRYGGEVRPKDLSRLAEMYFGVYMVVQFLLVCLLTPAAVAGAVADEKERRTLEFLLATDLRDREILFGKLASRVGALLLFLLAGVPVLSAIQFFGGIDPDLVVAGFAGTFTTALALAALGIAASVLAKRARDAIALTYLAAIAYLIVSAFVHVMALSPAVRGETVEVFGYTIAAEDVTYPLVAGNPFYMVPYVLETQVRRGGGGVFSALGHYVLFDAVVIALLVGWAGLRLRAIALAQAFGGPRRSLLRRLTRRAADRDAAPARRKAEAARPAVGDFPVVWKEVFVDTGLKLGLFGKLMILGLVVCSFVPAGILVWTELIDPAGYRRGGAWWSAARWDEFTEGMNAFVRVTGTIVGTLIFLAIAVRGAGAVSGERDRQSMDVLLTTPLTAGQIIWGKWWGCLLGMRWAWVWLGTLWLLGLAAGAVHPAMVVPFVLSTAVYASGFAWIGLFCSVAFRTTLRAAMAAIVLGVFCGGGYWLVILFCCAMPLSLSSAGPRDVFGPNHREVTEGIVDLLSSFSPPVNLAWLPVPKLEDRDLSLFGSPRAVPYLPFWFIGLGAWGLLSFGLSRRTVARFAKAANRVAMVPERRPRVASGTP